MKDCTTCKYGYEDKRLGIPMCHHPKRFSEDCIDFNMHEEKEIKESEKPVLNDREKAANEYVGHPKELGEGLETHLRRKSFIEGAKWQEKRNEETIKTAEDHAFLAGADWQKGQMLKDAVEGEVHPDDCEIWVNLVGYGYKFNDGDKVKLIIVKED